MLRERSKKEYKVSGRRSLHSGRSWSMPEEMTTSEAAQKSCEKVTSQQGTVDGTASGTIREAYEKLDV